MHNLPLLLIRLEVLLCRSLWAGFLLSAVNILFSFICSVTDFNVQWMNCWPVTYLQVWIMLSLLTADGGRLLELPVYSFICISASLWHLFVSRVIWGASPFLFVDQCSAPGSSAHNFINKLKPLVPQLCSHRLRLLNSFIVFYDNVLTSSPEILISVC